MNRYKIDKISNLFTKLQTLYDSLPETTCLGCPCTGGKDVVAECCRRGVPPAYQVEYFNMLNGTAHWSEEEKGQLLLDCIETARNPELDKPCVFLGENNECKIYNHRPLNCRLYGMCGGKSDRSRAFAWLTEAFAGEFPDPKDAEYYFAKLFSEGFDAQKINDTIERDFGVSRPSGFVNEECRNVTIEDGATVDDDAAWKSLEGIESSLLGTDVNKSKDNPSYMAFHITMILMNFGPEFLEKLLDERDSKK